LINMARQLGTNWKFSNGIKQSQLSYFFLVIFVYAYLSQFNMAQRYNKINYVLNPPHLFWCFLKLQEMNWTIRSKKHSMEPSFYTNILLENIRSAHVAGI
jgi:hypothetical protein